MGSSGAHARLSERSQPGDATFTLQPTTPFTVRRGNVDTGEILETKTFKSLPPVSQFHDSLGYYPGLRYNTDDEGVYFWDWQSSVILPAKGAYSTKITDGDKNPLPDLFGYEVEWDTGLPTTVLGTGDPRDDGVQYGVNLAVLDKARDGSWGSIAFWNAKAFGKLSMKATQAKGFAGKVITYAVTVKNTSPAAQPFSFTDVIPANTKYLTGAFYNPATKSIEWSGTIPAGQTRNFIFTVKINPGVSAGTKITNSAALGDDANGDAITQVVKVAK
jgi:uncharacterized repeat protein (TIGR01451 family)